jgi:hypothetical protein
LLANISKTVKYGLLKLKEGMYRMLKSTFDTFGSNLSDDSYKSYCP